MIGQVAAATGRIRVGSGGIMLPNHAPLMVAEQFGTLASLFPGRIDLGLGRAPGTDMNTARALRRHMDAGQQFPQEVVELLGYLGDASDEPRAGNSRRRDQRADLDTWVQPVWRSGCRLPRVALRVCVAFRAATH